MDLNTHVKSAIERLTCSIHHQNPSVILTGENIVINCCCSNFKVICLKLLIRSLVEHKGQTINIEWKKAD